MFVYTVYPIPGAKRKRTSRKVEPVSRVRPVHPVERSRAIQYNGFTAPYTQSRAYDKVSEKDKAKTALEWPTGELHMQNIMPVLLAWRRPKAATSPDYIQKRLARLLEIQHKHNFGRIRQ